MGALEYSTVTLVHMHCGECDCVFAMSQSKYNRCKEQGEGWHCPNGHSRVFTGSEVQKLRDELARERQAREQEKARLDSRITSLREDRDSALKRESALKGAKTRLKNRIANGVCPCCTRSFSNVQKHMAHMHPEYKKNEAT